MSRSAMRCEGCSTGTCGFRAAWLPAHTIRQWMQAHQDAARAVRELLAAWRDHEDLISVGAYRRGSNPLVDLALAMQEEINAFLRQRVDEPAGLAETREALLRIGQRIEQARNAAGRNGGNQRNHSAASLPAAEQPSQPRKVRGVSRVRLAGRARRTSNHKTAAWPNFAFVWQPCCACAKRHGTSAVKHWRRRSRWMKCWPCN